MDGSGASSLTPSQRGDSAATYGVTMRLRAIVTVVLVAVGLGMLPFALSEWGVVGDADRTESGRAARVGAASLAGPTGGQMRADIAEAITQSGPVTPLPAAARADGGQHLADGCAAAVEDPTPDFACLYGDPSASVKVALVGDSHAADWFEPLRRIGDDNDWGLFTLTKSGCSLTTAGESDDCHTYSARVVDGLIARDVAYVFVSTAAVDMVNADGAVPLWQRLQDSGATVVVLHDTPYPGKNIPRCVEKAADYRTCSFPRNPGHGTPGLLRTAEQVPGTVVIDLNDWVCPLGETCAPVVSNVLVWRDHSHLTATYAASLAVPLSHELQGRGIIPNPLELAGG